MIHQAKQKGRIMKRRMIAVLLSGILLCSAAGCGKEAVTDKSTAASSSQEVTETPAAEESPERAVCDYVSGMTDSYAMEVYSALYIPVAWSIK